MATSKKFLLVFGMFFILLMMTSMVSSAKWDNKEKFDKNVGKYGKYEIHDSWFVGVGYGKKLMDIELVNNSDYCFRNCLAIKEISTYEEESLVDDVRFYTLQEDNVTWVEQDVRTYSFYYVERQNKNKVGEWELYTEGLVVPEGDYFVKLEAEKKPTRTVDWQILTQGIWTEEWAVWEAYPILGDEIDNSYYPEHWVATLSGSGTHTETVVENNDYLQCYATGSGGGVNSAVAIVVSNGTTPLDYYNSNEDAWIRTRVSLLASRVGGMWSKSEFGLTDGSNTVWLKTINQAGSDDSVWDIYINASADTLELYDDEVLESSAVDISSLTGGNYFVIVSATIGSGGTGDSATATSRIYYVYEIVQPIILHSPEDNEIDTDGEVTFNATATATGGANLTNMTLYNNISGSWGPNGTIIIVGSNITSSTQTWDRTITGTTLWNIKACDTDGDCGWGNSNHTLFLDTDGPVINITSPLSKEDFGKENETIPLLWTVTDEHLDACWYEWKGTNTTVECNATDVTLQVTSLDDNEVIFHSNDTVENVNNEYLNWTYFLWQNDATFSPVVPEISEQEFTTNLSLPDGDTILSANFWYGNDSYTPDITLEGYNALLSYELTTPNVVDTTNFTFFWQITINPEINTTEENQTVIGVAMDNCSNFTDLVMNFTLVDEVTEELMIGVNSSIEIDLVMETEGGAEILKYFNTYSDTPYAGICLEELVANTTYYMDMVVSYVADGYVEEFWFLDDGELILGDDSLNDYVSRNVTLRSLTIDDSTTFLMSYQNEFRAIVPDSIVTVLRDYIGQGEFKEVERCQQDNNGQCHLHLVEEDVIYQFRITYLGELQYLSGEYNAKCLEVLCKITIAKLVEGGEWDDTLNNLDEGTYSVSSDKDTRLVTLDFNLEETGTMQLDVYEYDNNADVDVLVGTSTVTAKTGSTDVGVPLVYGNQTYYAVVRHNTGFVSSQWVDLNESGYQYFGALGLFLGALIILTLGLVAVSSGGWTIAFLILGMFVASITKLVDMDFYLMMWIVSAGGLIIWKLSTRRSI